MASDERTTVKTYVPRYQKDAWRQHAEDLDMSQSEFVRAMVQAGRREFDAAEPDSEGSDPGGDALEDRILETLASDAHLEWAQLRDELATEFERRLEATLQDLQERKAVEHSPRHGGYALREDDE